MSSHYDGAYFIFFGTKDYYLEEISHRFSNKCELDKVQLDICDNASLKGIGLF